jgi:hypothetical protein
LVCKILENPFYQDIEISLRQMINAFRIMSVWSYTKTKKKRRKRKKKENKKKKKKKKKKNEKKKRKEELVTDRTSILCLNSPKCSLKTSLYTNRRDHGHMARGGHGLPKVLL